MFGNQRPAAPWSFNNWWGQYDAYADLPNVAGSSLQLPRDVQEGDIAWVVATGALYVCTDSTQGAAVWIPFAGGGASDRFAPKILVGNTANGDSAIAQAFPNRYIPDPGDGTGIVTALSEIAALGQRGDIYLRPGLYDFAAASLPLVVPAGVTVHGPGGGLPTGFGGNPETGATLRVSASLRTLFQLGAAASLRSLAIEVGTPSVGATGAILVEATAAGAFVEDVNVFITAGANDAAIESLTRMFSGDAARYEGVIIASQNAYQPAAGLTGFYGASITGSRLEAQGVSVGYQLGASSTLSDSAAHTVLTGCEVLAGATEVRLSDLVLQGEERGLVVNGDQSIAANLVLDGADVETTIGLEVNGDDNTFTNVYVVDYDTGILVAATASDATVMNARVNSCGQAVSYGGDYFTLIGANLRNNSGTIAVVGAPASPEIAHVQV